MLNYCLATPKSPEGDLLTANRPFVFRKSPSGDLGVIIIRYLFRVPKLDDIRLKNIQYSAQKSVFLQKKHYLCEPKKCS